MSEVNLNSLIENLDSQQVSKQIPAMEETASIVETLAIKAVESLQNSSDRFLVAERLSRLGSIIIPYLERLIKESTDSEVQILGSLVLLQLNSRIGVPILLNAIEKDEEYAGLAAQHLVKLGMKNVSKSTVITTKHLNAALISSILSRLEKSSLKEVDLIESLLDSLSRLNNKLPQCLWKRFTSDRASWEIKTMCFDKFFPEEDYIDNERSIDAQWNFIITQAKYSSKTIKETPWISTSQQKDILERIDPLLPAR